MQPQPAMPPGRRSLSKTLRIAAILITMTLILLTVAIFAFVKSSDDYHVQLTFTDAQGIRRGAAVVYRGVEIGRVEELDVEESGVHLTLRITEGDVTLQESDDYAIVQPVSGPSYVSVDHARTGAPVHPPEDTQFR
ncbi:MAG: MlaD family protein [Planctomycetota bacterium]